MIDLTIVIALDFTGEELSVAPGLMTDAGNQSLHELFLRDAMGFGSFSNQRASILVGDGVDLMPVREVSDSRYFESQSSVLIASDLSSTLSGSDPVYGEFFDGEEIVPDVYENATMDAMDGPLTPGYIGSTLSGSHPQFRIPFGVDGESKPARENAKEEQIWV